MTVHGQVLLVPLVLLPGNVAVMGIVAYDRPLVTGNLANVELAIYGFRGARAPKNIRAGVGRVMQEAQDIMVLQRAPGYLAAVAATTQPVGKRKLLLAEVASRRVGRACLPSLSAEPVCRACLPSLSPERRQTRPESRLVPADADPEQCARRRYNTAQWVRRA